MAFWKRLIHKYNHLLFLFQSLLFFTVDYSFETYTNYRF